MSESLSQRDQKRPSLRETVGSVVIAPPLSLFTEFSLAAVLLIAVAYALALALIAKGGETAGMINLGARLSPTQVFLVYCLVVGMAVSMWTVLGAFRGDLAQYFLGGLVSGTIMVALLSAFDAVVRRLRRVLD